MDNQFFIFHLMFLLIVEQNCNHTSLVLQVSALPLGNSFESMSVLTRCVSSPFFYFLPSLYVHVLFAFRNSPI